MSDLDFDSLLQQSNSLRSARVRGRYAPSPTGSLHLGNLRTALYAWLQVRMTGGEYILRMEDLDENRARDGSAQEILDDLRWLGLHWDEGPDIGGPLGPYTQSERTEIYQQAMEQLRDRGLVYPCYCTRKDVRKAASAPHGPGGVVYPGTCRDLDEAGREERQAQRPGRRPAHRVIVDDRQITVEDEIAGRYAENLSADVGDFVIRRTDSFFAYQLAVVVDDALMGVTDVVRGADLLSSTPRQIYLYRILDLPVPRFWHAPLMVDTNGERLSKRDGSESLRVLRDEKGWDAARVIGHLAATLGWVEEGHRLTPQDLLEELDYDDLRCPLTACCEEGPDDHKSS